MKTCSRCGKNMPLSEFHRRADRGSGVQSHCKVCQHLRKRKYLESPEGKLRTKEYASEVYERDRDNILAYNALWRNLNCTRRKEYLQDYEKNRRTRRIEDLRRYSRKSHNKRYRLDIKFRIRRLVSSGIKRCIDGGRMGRKWEDILGYGAAQLIDRLKSTLPVGVVWEDFCQRKIQLHIDHIIPISAFSFSSIDSPEFSACWCLENLQLLHAQDNLRKSDKIL